MGETTGVRGIAKKENEIIPLGLSVSFVHVSCFKEQTSPFYDPGLRLLMLLFDVSLLYTFGYRYLMDNGVHYDTIHY